MATRNPANEIEFGVVNFGATITAINISGLTTDPSTEVSPGEDMEKLMECLQQRGTTIGFGEIKVTTGTPDTYDFNVYMEGSSWSFEDAEAAVQALGGIFAAATVAEGNL